MDILATEAILELREEYIWFMIKMFSSFDGRLVENRIPDVPCQAFGTVDIVTYQLPLQDALRRPQNPACCSGQLAAFFRKLQTFLHIILDTTLTFGMMRTTADGLVPFDVCYEINLM